MQVSRAQDDAYIPPPELIPAWQEHPEIVKLGTTVLREVAAPVTRILTGEMQHLIEYMKHVMLKAHGLGLAAPQVGISVRVIVLDIDDEIKVIVNPVISGGRGEQLEPMEGCLSIPGLQGQVKRFNEIRVRGQDQRGRPVSRKVSDLEARVIQHEVDHLDGVLFIDRAEPDTIAWVLASDADDGEMNPAPHD